MYIMYIMHVCNNIAHCPSNQNLKNRSGYFIIYCFCEDMMHITQIFLSPTVIHTLESSGCLMDIPEDDGSAMDFTVFLVAAAGHQGHTQLQQKPSNNNNNNSYFLLNQYE